MYLGRELVVESLQLRAVQVERAPRIVDSYRESEPGPVRSQYVSAANSFATAIASSSVCLPLSKRSWLAALSAIASPKPRSRSSSGGPRRAGFQYWLLLSNSSSERARPVSLALKAARTSSSEGSSLCRRIKQVDIKLAILLH